MKVQGKVALITGGARGIGRALGEELLRNGAKVCFVDVLKAELHETDSELRKQHGESNVASAIADVTNEQEFTAAFEHTIARLGQVDIVVNNASIQREGKWDLMLNVNLGGVIRGTLLAMKFMNPEKGGVVVNVGSTSGLWVTQGQMPLIPVYTCAKSGVIAYTRCFALNKEVIEKNIRIVCLCPRYTDTDMLKDESADKCWDIKQFYAVDRGRLMRVEELAAIFLQLAEDDSNNGKVALVEGVDKYSFV